MRGFSDTGLISRANVDVLIQTFNEEINLPLTLSSIQGWTNRIFVVDSGSNDRTVEIARERGATVVHHDWEGYARQKNWALDNLPFESDWVLILDADEAVSPELRDELRELVSRPADSVPESGFYLNRIFIFMGRKIRHCGYFPSWNLRLFKRGKARYEERKVHEHMVVDGPTGYLEHLLLHEDCRGLEHFVAKHNRYSTLEAADIYEHPEPWPGLRRFYNDRTTRRRFGKSRILPYLPVPWVWRFFYMYVLRAGFLDGRAGWTLSNLIGGYELNVQAKLRALKTEGGTSRGMSDGLAQPEGTLDPIEEIGGELGSVRKQMLTSTGSAAVTRRTRRYDDPELERLSSPWTLKENIGRALWMLVSATLFRFSFHNWYGWRRMLLKLFGASVGVNVRVRPTAKVEIPWNVIFCDGAVVGDHAIIYSLGPITIGKNVVISQYAHLCAGTHDYRYREFPLLKPSIIIGEDAWIAADSFVGPGVRIGDGAILGARASAFSTIPDWTIAVGNPAHPIKPRSRLLKMSDAMTMESFSTEIIRPELEQQIEEPQQEVVDR